MADSESQSALKITRGDKIIVTVESAIPDIIVVSYAEGDHSFQGALLNLNKRGLPCGINPPESDPDGDNRWPLASRFTYYQEKKQNSKIPAKVDVKCNINRLSKYKNARPTVRLRPRQVLCNKCRSICNEKNENVDGGKKRKYNNKNNPEIEKGQDILGRRRSERRNHLKDSGVGAIKSPVDNPQTANDKLSWEDSKSNVESSDPDENLNGMFRATPRRLSSSSIESAKIPDDETNSERKTDAKGKRVSRKKRSVGSMEDLWDETVFEDMIKSRNNPVIKISFGAEGEGTVLKIPLNQTFDKDGDEVEEDVDMNEAGELYKKCDKIDDEVDWDLADKMPRRSFKKTKKSDKYGDDDNNSNQLEMDDSNNLLKLKLNSDISYENSVDKLISDKYLSSSKAAKKALKKAKKGSKILNGNISPARYNKYDSSLIYHHRKRKDKHKKKHKDDRKHKNQDSNPKPAPIATINHNEIKEFSNGESYSAIKEQCLKQKLSISLKRLNTNAYARCDYSKSASSECKSSGISSEEHSENETDLQQSERNVTDFSPPSHSLSMRLTATSVEHCLTATGRRMDVGDIVWGKIHGFPWWPGKVLSLSVSCKEDGTSADAQAHVAWYGSSTCSLMSCDRLSPFLETFKARYNKKKRGPYKEAIRQAQSEARNQVSNANDILNVCQSPRQVDVIS